MEDFDTLIHEIKSRKNQVLVLEREIEDLRAEYGEKVLQHGNYKGTAGSIELRNGYTRVSFDSKTVEAVMNALHAVSPELAVQLESAKKVSFTSASWAVK